MKGLVSYSRPRGKYGRYIYTVVIDFEAGLQEDIKIELSRLQVVDQQVNIYSCDHCGRWATITVTRPTTTYTPLEASEHTRDERLEFFRYDNVEPGDLLTMTMRDTDLLFYQITRLTAEFEEKDMRLSSSGYATRNNKFIGSYSEAIYNVRLVNWDKHQAEKQQGQEVTVEEELTHAHIK